MEDSKHTLWDGPVENLWGRGVGGWGGGRAKYKKKIRARGKLNEKNSCTPINPKKYSCYGLKKIHTRNLITKKNSCGSKIPLPPITFLMVRKAYDQNCVVAKKPFHALFPFKMFVCFLLILYVCLYVIM